MGIRSYLQQRQQSTFYSGSNANRVTYVQFTASGGTVIPASTAGNGYQYHVFTSPGTFSVQSTPINSTTQNVECFVIGGGGGGGTGTGGGGGAGGVRVGVGTVSVGNYTITVGVGAAPASHPNASSNGNPSAIVGILTSSGGGRGASGSNSGVINASSPGGSGGGGMSYPTAISPAGGTGNSGGYTPVEGFPGGDGPGNGGGAGGGGAGGAGVLAAGAGGIGTFISACGAPIISPAIPSPVRSSWITAVGQGYYGGGGGGTYPSGSTGPGGVGGGGNGSSGPGATSGIDYTGGGGGANWGYTVGYAAGGGGSGIIIIRYPFGNLPTVVGYKTDFATGTQWFNPGYFGVEVHPDYRLINGQTYSSVTYRRVNVGSYYWWILLSQKTGLNTYNPVYGALIQTPADGTTGETLTANFSSAASTFGSATIPSTGDYYISWLSTAPGFTAPTGSIYVNEGSGGFINYVLTSTPPTTLVTYTTNSGNSANKAHIRVS